MTIAACDNAVCGAGASGTQHALLGFSRQQLLHSLWGAVGLELSYLAASPGT